MFYVRTKETKLRVTEDVDFLPETGSVKVTNSLMDENGLTWIQSAHCQSEAIAASRRTFVDHPANLLVLRNFLNPAGAERLSAFLRTEAQYETLYGLYSAVNDHPNGNAIVTESEFASAADSDKFYCLRKFVGLSKDLRLTPNLAAYLKFRTAFNQPTFRQFFMSVTGLKLDLTQATLQCFKMKPGDFLKHHDDCGNNFYRLAFVFYLTPNWQTRFGGALQMIDPDGKVTRVEPEYNSLVLFRVNPKTKHFIEPINADEDAIRVTISGWMHKPAQEQ